MSKRFRLRKIRLNEISLVDRPAEPNSVVTFFKRADGSAEIERTDMDPEQVAKDMEAAAAKIAELTEFAKEAETRAIEAEDKLAETEAKVTALAKMAEKGGDDDDDDAILKAADPTVAAEIIKLRKANAAAQKAMNEMREEGEIAKAVAEARKVYPNLPIKADEFGPILKRAAGDLPEEDFLTLTRLLKAGDAAMGELVTARGYGGMPSTSAEQEIEAKAKEIQKSDNVTFEKAYSKVLDLHPELYRRYNAERASSH